MSITDARRELPMWLKARPLRRVRCEGVSGNGNTWTCELIERSVTGFGYVDQVWTGTGVNWDAACRFALDNWKAFNKQHTGD